MPACDICYRRKVRCDTDDLAGPCKTCVNSGSNCTFNLAEQHKVKRRTRRRNIGARQHLSRPNSNLAPEHVDSDESTRAGTVTYPTREEETPELFHQSARFSVPPDADIVEDGLAKVALTRFYQHSINTSAWTVFDDMTHIRVAYIGTQISNLSVLVDEEALWAGGSQNSSLHLPFPAIRPIMPWKPPKSLPQVKWHDESFADDISALPAKDIHNDLIDSFFSKVHPGFPVVDEAQFRSQMEDHENPPPLLLLQAVLLVGAHVSDHPKVSQSRSLVKMALFRRAKALFDLHYENDRMHVVQAALLFTWHFEGADDVSSNVYYWSGIACRVAFGLGMHRDLSPSAVNRMPLVDRRIYRRIWWILYQVNVLASLHHGRPLMIDPDDCDQPALTPDDFIEYNGKRNINVDIDYCIQNASLCEIMISIMKQSTPGALRRHNANPGSFYAIQASLDTKLAGWYLSLPQSITSFSSDHSNFWSLQLQLHYNLALLLVHRISYTAITPAERQQSQMSKDTCHTAALSITKLFDDIIKSEAVAKCWFTALTLLLAAAIQISHEARSAAHNLAAVLALQAQSRLERLLPVMSAVSKYWSSAEAIFNLYKDLAQQLKRQTKSAFELQKQTQSPFSLQSPLLDETQLHLQHQDHAFLEDNYNLGSVGVMGNDWTTLFGAGDATAYSEMNFLGTDDWLL